MAEELSPRERRRPALLLGEELRGVCRVELLLQQLEDEDWQLRAAATKALGVCGEASHAEVVLGRLPPSPSGAGRKSLKGGRSRASTSVERSDSPSAEPRGNRSRAVTTPDRATSPSAPPLPGTGLADPSPEVRAASAEALGQINSRLVGGLSPQSLTSTGAKRPKALALAPKRLVALLADEDPRVRTAAVEALGCFGKAAEVVKRELQAGLIDSHAQVRAETIRALALLGPLAGKELQPVSACLQDRSEQVRIAAARVIGEQGSTAMKQQDNLALALGDPCADLRTAAADALFAVAGKEALLEYGPKGNGACRSAVAEALADRGEIGLLVANLADGEEEVRQAARESLRRRKINLAEHAGILAAKLTDSDLLAREYAVRALGNLRKASQGYRSRLLKCLEQDEAASAAKEDHEWPVRVAAAEALGKIGLEGDGQFEALAAALEDREQRVRAAVCLALGSFGPAAMGQRPALALRLKDRDRDVRRAAAEALGRLGPVPNPAADGVLQDLRRLLGDWNREVLQAAALAMGRIGGGEVLEPFMASRNSDVRVAAKDALGALGKGAQGQTELLRAAATRPNATVQDRYTAQEALNKIEKALMRYNNL